MDRDTNIGRGDGRFPATHRSVVQGMRDDDPVARRRGFDALISGYWKPVYKYLRIQWNVSNEEAKDLTQGFFARVIERGLLDAYDPKRSGFRTFLRVCLDRFVSNERASAARMKRGGDRRILSLDFDGAETEFQRCQSGDTHDVDGYFHREWVRSLFALSVDGVRERLSASGKESYFLLFQLYDLREPGEANRVTYEQLAERFQWSTTQVTNRLALVRRMFRAEVLGRLREMTGGEAEFREEARALLGAAVE